MKLIRPTEIPENDLTATEAVLTASNVAADDASEWTSGTSYSTDDQVIVLGVHQRLYEALQSTTGDFPHDNPTVWNDLGSINRWKMFDAGTNTQTVNQGSIDVTLDPDSIVNSFALFNILASQAEVTMETAAEGVVFNKSYNLIDNSGVFSWYSYFFEPVTLVRFLSDLSLPAYGDATITVNLTAPDDEAKCGLMLIGDQVDIGTTVFGTSVGIRDFSRKEVDDFGNFSVVERRFFRTVDYDARIETSKVQYVQRVLSDRRAKPTVYIGDENNPETIVYGYYRDFDIVLSNPAFSNATIEVEGL